jgi:hypothetical protein
MEELERILKEAVVAYFKLLSRNSHGGNEESQKNLSQDSRFRDRDLNPGPQEYEAGALTITFGHVPMRTVRM